jgi:hypothetical protein
MTTGTVGVKIQDVSKKGAAAAREITARGFVGFSGQICRVFVGFFGTTRHQLAQHNQQLKTDLSGLSGFYREERAAEKFRGLKQD